MSSYNITGNVTFSGNLNSVSIAPKVSRLPEPASGGLKFEYGFAFIDSDGNVRFVGDNTSSRFGSGASKEVPCGTVMLPTGVSASKIYLFDENLFILTTDGNVYSMGDNAFGQCGVGGSTTDINSPTSVHSSITAGDVTITKVIMSSAYNFAGTTMFLTSDGTVYACGKNQWGVLGIGNTTDTGTGNPELSLGPGNGYSNPTTTVSDVIGIGGQLTNHDQTFCALLSNGTVYCVGYGNDGQMGNGLTSSTNSSWQQVIKDSDDSNLTNITNIYGCGTYGRTSLYALDSSNNLYAWGYNDKGQLGTGNTTSRSKAVLVETGVLDVYPASSDSAYVIIKKASNTFYATGYNNVGQLGLGNETNVSSFTEITSLNGLGIDTIYVADMWQQASVFALNTTTNLLYATGANAEGQLGLYDLSNRNTFTLVPFYPPANITNVISSRAAATSLFTAILTEDGETYFAGRTTHGMFDNTDGEIPLFVKNTRRLTG